MILHASWVSWASEQDILASTSTFALCILPILPPRERICRSAAQASLTALHRVAFFGTHVASRPENERLLPIRLRCHCICSFLHWKCFLCSMLAWEFRIIAHESMLFGAVGIIAMPISHGWNVYFPQTIGQCALIFDQGAPVLSNLDGGGYMMLNI